MTPLISRLGAAGARARLGALAVALAALACTRGAAAEVVARVGETDVTAEELRAYVETLGADERKALAASPALLAQAVRGWLARRAVLNEALARRWDLQPAVAAQLRRLRERAIVDLYLDDVSAPPVGFPGDSEVQAAYDENRRSFEVPKQHRVAQIFLAVAPGDGRGEEEARRRIEVLSRRVREEGADFAAIARAESEDATTAPRGGEIGWLSESAIVPGIRKVVASLAPGGVSGPVRLEDGWHLVKVLEVRPAAVRPLAEVRAAIAAQLREERARRSRQAHLARLLEQQPPVINELDLSKVLPKER